MSETNEKTQFNTMRPFMAIVPDEVDGSYFSETHGVYLVNPLDHALCNVYESIGGFFSTEDGVIEANPKTKGPFEIQPHSALLFERTSRDEFDELVCWWSVAYDAGGVHYTARFSAGKALRDTEWIDVCPVLGRRALIVSG